MSDQFSTQYESPDQSPGFLLWQVSNLWQRQQKEALAQLNLTHVQFVLLAVTSWMESQNMEVTQVKLAERAKTDRMMTSQVLRALETRGLITRNRHPMDTRARIVQITATGQKLIKKAVPIVEEVDQNFFSKLKDESLLTKQMLELI